ncbi:hypothetical protein BAUCODRAFT_228368 [Baudoinia panamericana UAMH 10762]|uniref:Uncharacterized protein n=1 Tax=Baudoinia panamericana (strain UAMH 10762) TaxID=717646 RepID=M2LJ65_BAUPA|nr:uncharacterized protein BAUCODRAFT_228368 [Baudoinia panamericana UAMH 10762]EMC94272.1 hypothetical protein BAUCODRAFT_228368 [Baudoinia panamericana UAMH 10762]
MAEYAEVAAPTSMNSAPAHQPNTETVPMLMAGWSNEETPTALHTAAVDPQELETAPTTMAARGEDAALASMILETAAVSRNECRLLSLPAEQRNAIYHLAMVQPRPLNVAQRTDVREPGLLSTCKQIRAEALAVFYGTNLFRDINTAPRYYIDVATGERFRHLTHAPAWLKQMSSAKRALIRRIEVCYKIDIAQDLFWYIMSTEPYRTRWEQLRRQPGPCEGRKAYIKGVIMEFGEDMARQFLLDDNHHMKNIKAVPWHHGTLETSSRYISSRRDPGEMGRGV